MTVSWGSDDDASTATVIGRSYEGAPAVTGLPPLVEENSLAMLQEATGANVMVVQLANGRVLARAEDTVSEIPVASDSDPWSDGSFVYWQVFEDTATGQSETTSFVSDLTGNIICEAPGRIHTTRRLPDGTHVASVETDEEPTATSGDNPVPNFAVDCESGNTQPIEPRTYLREGGGGSTLQIEGRSFARNFDAEGNADVLNDAGISINGDDYAGFHTFSPDASQVVYGDYGVSFSPHITTTIRVRDTTTGDLLWSFVLPLAFESLSFTDDHVAVGLPPEDTQFEPRRRTESIVILDAATGLQSASIPTTIDIVHLS